MRKLFDKLTGRDKLKAEIELLDGWVDHWVVKCDRLCMRNTELRRELEYFKQPVEKVEEVQEVLALGFKPFEEVPSRVESVRFVGISARGLFENGKEYCVRWEGESTYIIDGEGDKLFFNLENRTFGWFNKNREGLFRMGDSMELVPSTYA